ncbi:MAG: biotin--[acetyl-CoA-carboxylase] ligase [Treponema sp.]|jgi:BirA family biotin operon repressor/biotin-[acetyl-CoA-carboxylase] ligase|nr:biotin--[acetyl-CoA-carboxylase] ligase [Treponema sp.]
MVNREGLSTRAYIVRELRKEPGSRVRGENLAAGLGLSRVAVWKGVQSLIAAGYPITSAESGYCLAAGQEDPLYPWEFGEREGLFRCFDSTGSTMDRAREYAETPGRQVPAGLGPFMVFTAETQSAGRGRSGRNWASEPGGLFFTVLESPGLALADYPVFSMKAQIAAARTVEALTGKRAGLRWPNDVYAGGGKIAGILTELSGEENRLRWIAAGVGINVNNFSPVSDGSGPGRALSCAELAGRRLSRREGLALFLGEMEKLRDADARELRDLWTSRAGGIGAQVSLIPAEHGEDKERGKTRVVGRGIFLGIDSRFRCRIGPCSGTAGPRAYPPGTVSLIYHGV